jgi:peptidoglycan hydrolase-like protein with peptidoglycan-binding domain
VPGRHRPAAARSLAAPARFALTATAAAMVVQPLATASSAAAARGATTLTAAAPATAARTTAVVPRPSRTLPAALDVVPSYSPQNSCDPVAKPGVEAYARMVLSTYRIGHSGGIVRNCFSGDVSEHHDGRAFDWMVSVDVPAEKAAGDALTAWLIGRDEHGVLGGNARRLGVMYVIWNRRIWGAYSAGAGWRPYSGVSPHTDHVHTSFSWDGAMGRTSWWDGTATTDDDRGPCASYAGAPAPVYTGVRRTTPCPTNLPAQPRTRYPTTWPAQSGSAVEVAQSSLGLPADGSFGSSTRTALMRWQKSVRLPVTGVLDQPTWARLVPSSVISGGSTGPTPPAPIPPPPPPPAPPAPTPPTPAALLTTSLTPYLSTTLGAGARGAAVAALQRALGIVADGDYGPITVTAVEQVQVAAGRPVTGTVEPATWAAIQARAYPLLGWRTTTLATGSTGAAVLALQRALAVTADGDFGPQTAGAVTAAQTRARLAATGVVDAATWVAVEAAAYPIGRRLLPPDAPTAPGSGAPAPTPTPPPAPTTPAPTTPAPTTATPTPTPAGRVYASKVVTTTSVSAYKDLVLRQGATGAAVTALQRALGQRGAERELGPLTASTVRAFQTAARLPATGVVDRRTWDAVERAAHPLLTYRRTVLRPGSTGPAVIALQRALGVVADGEYGALTVAAVKAAQVRASIASTGVVAALTWVTIEKQAYPVGARRW